MKNITFRAYLAQLIDNGISEETDGPAADFALDAVADRDFPKAVNADAEGFFKIVRYLYYFKHVEYYVLDAFMECWESFCRDTAGEGQTEKVRKDSEEWYDLYDIERITGIKAEAIPDMTNRGRLAIIRNPANGEHYIMRTDLERWIGSIIERMG